VSDRTEHDAPGGMDAIDDASEPVPDSDDPGGMSGIPDPDPEPDDEDG
jgi:hypothetical protein